MSRFDKFEKRRIVVNVGEEYEVEIVGIGSKGDGIAKIEGLTVIIPDTEQNQKYRIKINRVLETYAFGEVIEWKMKK